MSADDEFAQLAEETGITGPEWQDLLSNSPDDQAFLLTSWKQLGRMAWAENPSTFDRVLALLMVIGNIAGVVGGVAGATSAVAGLRSL